MKCFSHQESEAVGLCKYCHKGVCSLCAAEVNGSIACADTCQEKVAAVDSMVNKSLVTVEAQSKNRMFMPAFFLVAGLAIVIVSYIKTGGLGLSSIMGGVFIVFGIVLLLINQKWVKDMQSKT
ncbi:MULTISPECIES: hypothetical protein [Alteromonas]|uniref:hypothetical protein n=1 Tax=Alteromonas TaxID=226 RepID=UPI001C44FDA9|nr:hypothetical protein [Alteromonas lipotrueae]